MLVLVLAACGGEEGAAAEATRGPDAVTEAYLRSAADEAAARALLDPACHADAAAVRVDAARMMGVPITIEGIEVSITESTEESARVHYQIRGPVHGEGGETEVLGVRVQTGRVDMEEASRSGDLTLRRVEGTWLVACGG